MILHVAGTSGASRIDAMRAIEAKDGTALRALLTRSGSIDAARAKAVGIVEEAKSLLPATRRAHSRELLLELADRVVARDA
jgi:geranylgeranyl pyrophosphate synthase